MPPPNGGSGLPEAPVPQVARAIPPGKLFAFGSSAGMPMPARPPQDSGSETNARSGRPNEIPGLLLFVGISSMAVGGIAIDAAGGGHTWGNSSPTALRHQGEGCLGLGAALTLIGVLGWHRHPAQHSEAAPVSGPPPAQPQGNTLPPAQAIGRNPNGATTTTIRNNTPYTLQVQIGVCPCRGRDGLGDEGWETPVLSQVD